MFDMVYILSEGRCLYQGTTDRLVPFLSEINLPCPQYHNPADYGKIIKLNYFIQILFEILYFSNRTSVW